MDLIGYLRKVYSDLMGWKDWLRVAWKGIRGLALASAFGVVFGGWFTFECYNADGTLAWRDKAPAWRVNFPNGTTTGGLNDILGVYFNSGTQKTTWYLGLIDNASFSSLSAADTMSSHSGWIENTDYSESVRQTWVSAAASGGIITTSTVASFTANASVTIKGAFLTSSSTKGGTTGVLWATGAFSSTQSLTSSQVLQVYYTCSATGS